MQRAHNYTIEALDLFSIEGGFFLGGVLYQFVGLQCPFLVITGINISAALLLLLSPKGNSKPRATTSLKSFLSLLKDGEIIAGLGE